MRLAISGVLLLFACILSGCSKYWYQEGKSFRQVREDLQACHGEAVRYADPGRTQELSAYDGKFVRRCMQERGYQLVGEKALPLRVKRETSPVFGVPGVAGTLD